MLSALAVYMCVLARCDVRRCAMVTTYSRPSRAPLPPYTPCTRRYGTTDVIKTKLAELLRRVRLYTLGTTRRLLLTFIAMAERDGDVLSSCRFHAYHALLFAHHTEDELTSWLMTAAAGKAEAGMTARGSYSATSPPHAPAATPPGTPCLLLAAVRAGGAPAATQNLRQKTRRLAPCPVMRAASCLALTTTASTLPGHGPVARSPGAAHTPNTTVYHPGCAAPTQLPCAAAVGRSLADAAPLTAPAPHHHPALGHDSGRRHQSASAAPRASAATHAVTWWLLLGLAITAGAMREWPMMRGGGKVTAGGAAGRPVRCCRPSLPFAMATFGQAAPLRQGLPQPHLARGGIDAGRQEPVVPSGSWHAVYGSMVIPVALPSTAGMHLTSHHMYQCALGAGTGRVSMLFLGANHWLWLLLVAGLLALLALANDACALVPVRRTDNASRAAGGGATPDCAPTISDITGTSWRLAIATLAVCTMVHMRLGWPAAPGFSAFSPATATLSMCVLLLGLATRAVRCCTRPSYTAAHVLAKCSGSGALRHLARLAASAHACARAAAGACGRHASATRPAQTPKGQLQIHPPAGACGAPGQGTLEGVHGSCFLPRDMYVRAAVLSCTILAGTPRNAPAHRYLATTAAPSVQP